MEGTLDRPDLFAVCGLFLLENFDHSLEEASGTLQMRLPSVLPWAPASVSTEGGISFKNFVFSILDLRSQPPPANSENSLVESILGKIAL